MLKRAVVDEQAKVVATVRDISPRKKAISDVKQRELLLDSINRNISEGLYRSYSKGGLISANEAFAKMFGYSSVKEILSVKSLKPKDRKGLTPAVIELGLGMYIVKQAVDKLKGTVTIKSKLNKGTKIEVKIP